MPPVTSTSETTPETQILTVPPDFDALEKLAAGDADDTERYLGAVYEVSAYSLGVFAAADDEPESSISGYSLALRRATGLVCRIAGNPSHEQALPALCRSLRICS